MTEACLDAEQAALASGAVAEDRVHSYGGILEHQGDRFRDDAFARIQLSRVPKSGLPGFGEKTLRKQTNLSRHSLGNQGMSA